MAIYKQIIALMSKETTRPRLASSCYQGQLAKRARSTGQLHTRSRLAASPAILAHFSSSSLSQRLIALVEPALAAFPRQLRRCWERSEAGAGSYHSELITLLPLHLETAEESLATLYEGLPVILELCSYIQVYKGL